MDLDFTLRSSSGNKEQSCLIYLWNQILRQGVLEKIQNKVFLVLTSLMKSDFTSSGNTEQSSFIIGIIDGIKFCFKECQRKNRVK